MSTDFADRKVYQALRRCLWLLDSGDLANASLAIKETDLVPGHLAAAIVLEARRLYPAPDNSGSADASLERQIKFSPPDVSQIRQKLAEEINGRANLTAERFEVLRRLLRAVPEEDRLNGERPLIVAGTVQLDRLAGLLDQAEHEPKAEKELRDKLFDASGHARRETTGLFATVPFLRSLVQAAVDNAKLRGAGQRRAASVLIATCLLLVIVGSFSLVLLHRSSITSSAAIKRHADAIANETSALREEVRNLETQIANQQTRLTVVERHGPKVWLYYDTRFAKGSRVKPDIPSFNVERVTPNGKRYEVVFEKKFANKNYVAIATSHGQPCKVVNRELESLVVEFANDGDSEFFLVVFGLRPGED